MIDAFIILLEHKEFEYITIKEICSLAKVNRSTFYLHYSNTSDLLEESIYRLTESFNKHLGDENKNFNINNISDLKSLFFINDKFLFNATVTYENLFIKLFSPILTKFKIEEKWHKFIMDFYIAGLSSILFNWINTDFMYGVDEIAKLIKDLIIYYDKEIN